MKHKEQKKHVPLETNVFNYFFKIENFGKFIFQDNEVIAQAFFEEKFCQHVGFFSTSIRIVIMYGFILLQIIKL
jgi:hypothetical protein